MAPITVEIMVAIKAIIRELVMASMRALLFQALT